MNGVKGKYFVLFQVAFLICMVALPFQSVAANQKTDAAPKVGGKTKVGPLSPTGGTPLTTSDCKLLLGGAVIQVFDGRCGKSGKYCKSSAGAACINE